MPRDLDLKRRLELAGLTVTEVDGWQTRGKEDFNPTGSVHHHTGGALNGVQPSLGVVINGRSDLAGPLCNVHGPREESLRVNLVAAGRANHAGLGGFRGLSGNSTVWGLKEEHTGGPNEPVSELRLDRMARVHAAFLFGTSDASWNCQHREWAPTRKVDFIAKWCDADDLRERIQTHLDRMAHPTVQEDDMTFITTPEKPGRIVLLHAGRLVHVSAIVGIDKDQNTWDLSQDAGTWASLQKAYGPVVG